MLELALVNIVLILPHPDALRVNLHELGKGIHQSAAYRHGSTHRDILVGELLTRHLGS